MQKFKNERRMIFISMTMTATNIDMNNVNFLRLEKTEEDRAEEKAKYNNFMNFMTDIIVKYGLNEKDQ